MTEERKVEVTVEDTPPAEPDVKVEVNVDEPKKDKEEDKDA